MVYLQKEGKTMRKIPMVLLLSTVILLMAGSAIALVDSNATPETQALYAQLKATSGKQIFFGQFYPVKLQSWDDPYGTQSQCYKIIQEYPFIFSLDYQADPWRSITAYTNQIKTHYSHGGVITVSWHMQNWVNGGDSWNLTGNVVTSILPGGSQRTQYLAALDGFANYFLNLKDANGKLIPVMLRLFHENDGNWFWWGTSTRTPAQYVQLWHDFVTYIRDKKGVHNIIYCYAPEIINGYAYDGDLYPGDNYVDVLGLDYYDKTVTTPDGQGVSDLNRLQILHDLSVKKSKPFGILEGLRNEFPSRTVSNPNKDGIYAKYWTDQFMNPILADSKAKYASFVVIWHSDPSGAQTDGWGPVKGYADQQSFKDMSNNSKVKFLKY